LAFAYRALFPAVSGNGWDGNVSTFAALVNQYAAATTDAKKDSARLAAGQYLATMTVAGGGPPPTRDLSPAQMDDYAAILEGGSPFEPIWNCATVSHPGGASARDLATLYHNATLQASFPYAALVNAATAWKQARNDQTRVAFSKELQRAGSMPGLAFSDEQLDQFGELLTNNSYVVIAPFKAPGNTY